MKNFWKFLSFILFGWIIGYFVKDNVGKPDEVTNNQVKQKERDNVLKIFKKNPLKEKRKVFNFLRKKENKV